MGLVDSRYLCVSTAPGRIIVVILILNRRVLQVPCNVNVGALVDHNDEHQDVSYRRVGQRGDARPRVVLHVRQKHGSLYNKRT